MWLCAIRCSNCTLVELKQVPVKLLGKPATGSNCTLVELKQPKETMVVRSKCSSNCTLVELKLRMIR